MQPEPKLSEPMTQSKLPLHTSQLQPFYLSNATPDYRINRHYKQTQAL